MENPAYHTASTIPFQPVEQTIYPPEEMVKLPEFGYLTISSMRHLIFNSRPRYSASGDVIAGNGLVEAGVIIRIGRRVLIDIVKFREWTQSQRETVQSP